MLIRTILLLTQFSAWNAAPNSSNCFLTVEKIQPKRVGNRFENPWDSWEGLPGPIGVFRWFLSRKNRNSLIDAILISHSHFDHLDLKTVKQLNERFGSNLTWFVPLGLRRWFLKTGCEKVEEKIWWQETNFTTTSGSANFTVKIVALPCQHWSGRWLFFDKNKSLWSSWAIIGQSKGSFYFAGDTGYCPVFKSIGQLYGPFTLAAIPIGCYEPRWFMKNQHVAPNESVLIHNDVRAENSIGIHWGTYDVGCAEDFTEPKIELERQVHIAGLRPGSFSTIDQGQSWKSSENS